MKHKLGIITMIVSVLGTTMAFADCIDGVRKETAAEAAYFRKVQAALKEVFPPPPSGWTFTPPSDENLGGLCQGTAEGAFTISASAKYTYRPSKEEADRMNAESRKIQSELDALEKLPAELAKERNELNARYSEKARAARQADVEGKKELAHSLYAERDAFGRQANEVRDKHLASVKPKANERYPQPPVPGQETVIDVGKVPSPKSPGLKVHGVRAVARGRTPNREAIMSLVDKAKMQRVLQ